MRDTSPEAAERYFELLRARSPLERLRMAASLTRSVRSLAEAAILAEHPAATPAELRHRLAERIYGQAAAVHLFPPERRDAG